MVSKTFLITLLFVTSLNPTNLPGQDNGCTRRTVPVSVVDREWNLVRGLSAANFRGKLRGHEVEILSASMDTSPRHIVLLLDASGSMMEDTWATAKSISEDLIRFAPPWASIAQMGFSETVLYTADFDQDRFALLKSLAALVKVCEQPRKSRKTALYDAIASVRGTLPAAEFGDTIFAVTDSEDNESRTEPKRVEEGLVSVGLRVFSALIIGSVAMQRGRVPEGMGPGQLVSMVEGTGGNALTLLLSPTSPPNPYPYLKARTRKDAIDLALQRLCEQMGEFYRLELRLPVTVDKPTKWELQVIDTDGKPHRRVEVHYPRQLMPCANAGLQ